MAYVQHRMPYCRAKWEQRKSQDLNKPQEYKGFVRLTLDDGSIVELEGSGELTRNVTELYLENTISAEIGTLCTVIYDATFAGCSSLSSVTISNSVASIGYQAFYGCSGLTSIKVDSGNTVYDSRNDCNAIIETETNKLIAGCKNTVIPNDVTSIGNYAFDGCRGLTAVTIPNSVTSIGEQAFSGCNGLTAVTIPNSVTSIGSYAFYGCSGLTSVTIGNSVTSIGYAAFADCSSLAYIMSLATTAPTIENNTFQRVKTSGILYTPLGSTGYDTWLDTGDYYLGKYNWTKIEQ